MSQTKPTQSFDTGAVSGIIGYRLRRAQVSVFQQFMARFAQFGLTPAEYSALALIGANPGSKQTQIGEALGIKRANFVTLINALEERGLTERRQPAGDRRANALFLTEAGEAFVAKVNAVQAQFEAEMVEQLGGQKARDQLVALLDRLMPAQG
ncbi:MAG TPA: MarR family winged helix-turn-helix transcriptional regulator [Devosia sp.]|jgi:DNA-binding MarR family transcriptional regulator|uniref:MarR family winged helix-turn-helix transcriptional regulator n=1 Tax=Devosia sp. TaxID=1871048 RepID=UPI002DDD58F4|nr:MarR family winged helix-turn-helix transcriptional regulator [Devosia sp.]HEV2514068.1 MarR family winged helix-turn-helix transcriptional regulator [Devosia sp.]